MIYAVLLVLAASAYTVGRTRPLARVKANAWENVVWKHYVAEPVTRASTVSFILLYPYTSFFKGWWHAVRPQLPGRPAVDLSDEFAARRLRHG